MTVTVFRPYTTRFWRIQNIHACFDCFLTSLNMNFRLFSNRSTTASWPKPITVRPCTLHSFRKVAELQDLSRDLTDNKYELTGSSYNRIHWFKIKRLNVWLNSQRPHRCSFNITVIRSLSSLLASDEKYLWYEVLPIEIRPGWPSNCIIADSVWNSSHHVLYSLQLSANILVSSTTKCGGG